MLPVQSGPSCLGVPTLPHSPLPLPPSPPLRQSLCASYVASDDSHVEMRIGLHIGPVTAGIIGTRMLRYQ